MPGKPPPTPPADRRKERLAEALRANLKRRKAAVKMRAGGKGQDGKNDVPGIAPQAGLRDKPGS